MYLFADHQFGLATGTFATAHQLHHPQRNYTICFECQQHKRIEHCSFLYIAKTKGLKWFPKSNPVANDAAARQDLREKKAVKSIIYKRAASQFCVMSSSRGYKSM
jgi:hypothetical protein